ALGSLQALSAVGNITGSLLSLGFLWRTLFVVGIVPALLVVLVRRRLEEPERWKQARREETVAPQAAAMGSLGDMLHDPRWRYHTLIGVLLAVSGVIGLWGAGFWTFELVEFTLRNQGYSSDDIRVIRGWGTALQDVGACVGMVCFSVVAARIGRRI